MVTIKNWVAKFRVFLLVVAVVISGCTPKGPKALLDGKELIDKGRYADAVKKLQLATSLIGTNATAWNYLGIAYHHSGQSTNAEQAYLKALSLDRNLAEAHYNLGCLRLEENQFDPARSELIVYTSLRGNAVDGWLKLGVAQLKLRELPGAERSFGEALRLEHENAEALDGLGVIQLERRNPREAARLFDAALAARPDYAPALLNLAIVNHVYLNNRPLALQKYREYLALSPRPENWEAVNATAQTLDMEINPRPKVAVTSTPAPAPNPPPKSQPVPPPPSAKPAGEIASRATTPKPESQPIAKTPTTPAATSPAAVTKLSPDQMVKPPQDVEVPSRPAPAAGRPNPVPVVKSEPVKTNKGGFLRTINPMNLFRSSATNSRPVSPTPLPKLAESEAPAGGSVAEPSPSFPHYRYRTPTKPVTGDSAAAERAFLQGSKAHQAGRLTEAIKFYSEATKLNPAYFDAFYNLGLAATGNGNLSQALSAYETALAIRPDSADARYNFAVVLKQANYMLDSVRELEAILARNSNDARAHVALGNIYAQSLRQPAKAREHYLKALEIDPRHPQAPAIHFWLTSH
ncbi:MAG TPA: tetratricopeptide repeat protein [Candidatus Paceibacterota bacterium]|nr:tetratricopeptide repeat protein [Candidatus Paceibacterota bacterium]